MLEKGPKKSSGPKTDLLGKTKRGARRLDMKIGGVKQFSSFVWTLVVKKKNGKGKRETTNSAASGLSLEIRSTPLGE